MFIIEVIPITTLPQNVPQILSYFSNIQLNKGSLVMINMNNRKIPAVVVSSEPVESRKIQVKKTDFQLKNINGIISEKSLVSDHQFKLALWLAKTYYAPLSLSLKTTFPPFMFLKKYDVSKFNFHTTKPAEQKAKPRSIITGAKNSIQAVESSIKKILKEGRQVLIILPELTVINFFHNYFSKYYPTALIHGKLNNENFYKEWEKVNSGKATIIIGTRQAVFAPYKDLGMVIVEDPEHEAYKSDMSPKYNTPDLAEHMSQIYNAEFVLVSGSQSIKDIYATKNNSLVLDKRLDSGTEVITINITKEFQNDRPSILTEELIKEIQNSFFKNKKILVFSPRKGFSSTLMCLNCGLTAKCSQCSIPMRVQKKPEPLLICYHCSLTRKIPAYCPNCNSNKIRAVGMPGSQKISDAIQKIFENEPRKPELQIFDADFVKNEETENKIIQRIKENPDIITVASHLIFSHRYLLDFDLIIIPNADALSNIPDFKTHERTFYNLNKLLDFRPKKMIIQTFEPENLIFKSFAENNYDDFYDQELDSRKNFNYPPYLRLIKMESGSKNKDQAFFKARTLTEKLKLVTSQLGMLNSVQVVGPIPTFIEKENRIWRYNIILKTSLDFPIEKILKFVPSDWKIIVDPKSLI